MGDVDFTRVAPKASHITPVPGGVGPLTVAMVIAGTWPASPAATSGPLTRMTYTRNTDGSVRQFGEQSTDQGHVWAPAFDFTYRPHAGSPG